MTTYYTIWNVFFILSTAVCSSFMYGRCRFLLVAVRTITRTRAWYVAGNYLRELGHVHYSQWTCFARRFPVGRYTRYYIIIQTIRTIHINNSDGGNNFDVQRFPFFSFLFFYDQNDRFDFVQNRNTCGPRLLLRSYGIMLIRLIVIMININNNN